MTLSFLLATLVLYKNPKTVDSTCTARSNPHKRPKRQSPTQW